MSLLADTRRVIYGEAKVSAVPSYWRTGPVTADNGTPFEVVLETLPFYAEGIGGEAEFRELTLHFQHTLGGDFTVTPIVDGSAAAIVSGTVTIAPVTLTFRLPQQAAGAEARRTSVVVPLVRALQIAGREHSRYYLRGHSFAARIARVSTLGSGVLRLDGAELRHEPMRRTDHQEPLT